MPDRVSEDVLAADLPGETVLLHLADKRYFRLNETGQRIWQLLADGRDRAAVLRRLTTEYDVAERVAGAELDRFLEELRGTGLLCPDDVAG